MAIQCNHEGRPMSRAKLTKQDKVQITKDWQARFPALGIYRPMHLLNRLGPIVVGILLEVKSGNCDYTPSFHVHNLMTPFPVVTLGMQRTTVLKNIPLSRHSHNLESAVKQIAELALIPFAGDVPVTRVISAYNAHCLEQKQYMPYIPDYEGMILIAGWSRDTELLDDAMQFSRQMFAGLPESTREKLGKEWLDDAYHSAMNQLDSVYQRALNPDELDRIARNQAEGLKLSNLPVRALLT